VTPLSDSEADWLMGEALAEAEAAAASGEYPIGAVVAISGEVVSRGRARHRSTRSQLAHAELEALVGGGEPLWTRHDEAVLVTTIEPCPMCIGATVMADVPHVVFALPDPFVETRRILEVPYVRRHISSYRGGVREAEARALVERLHPRYGEVLERR
jgi:tRNA(adenine34) deaminase